jgi:hypothetical protein
MLTDKEIEALADDGGWINWGFSGFGPVSIDIEQMKRIVRTAYDKACEDCAKVCEKDDYGAGSSAGDCRSLKHKGGE